MQWSPRPKWRKPGWEVFKYWRGVYGCFVCIYINTWNICGIIINWPLLMAMKENQVGRPVYVSVLGIKFRIHTCYQSLENYFLIFSNFSLLCFCLAMQPYTGFKLVTPLASASRALELQMCITVPSLLSVFWTRKIYYW